MKKDFNYFLDQQSKQPYFKNILNIIQRAKKEQKIIFPKEEDFFHSFEITPFNKTMVIIFGQDPYYSEGMADGLAFSTKITRTPKSLINVFKELKREYPLINISCNDLSPWSTQGVLLLNTSLSVEKNLPNSHSKIGWETFTKNFINFLNEEKEFLIFVLWGNNAKKLKSLISPKFYILESSHPSPLSAHNGFLGNNHFKKINEILHQKNMKIIDWNL